jgi:hypothetical protein
MKSGRVGFLKSDLVKVLLHDPPRARLSCPATGAGHDSTDLATKSHANNVQRHSTEGRVSGLDVWFVDRMQENLQSALANSRNYAFHKPSVEGKGVSGQLQLLVSPCRTVPYLVLLPRMVRPLPSAASEMVQLPQNVSSPRQQTLWQQRISCFTGITSTICGARSATRLLTSATLTSHCLQWAETTCAWRFFSSGPCRSHDRCLLSAPLTGARYQHGLEPRRLAALTFGWRITEAALPRKVPHARAFRSRLRRHRLQERHAIVSEQMGERLHVSFKPERVAMRLRSAVSAPAPRPCLLTDT